MSDDWPDRMIDQRPEDKARWIQTDVHRYYQQCRAERLEEARAELGRSPRPCRPCGGSHPASPSRWRRLLHWAGWRP